MIPSPKRLFPLSLILGLLGGPCLEMAAPVSMARAQSARAVELKVRQTPNGVDVIMAGVGPDARLVDQRLSANAWAARLLAPASSGLSRGPQQIALPSAGLQSIRLSGSGSKLDLLVETGPGVQLPSPEISDNGLDLTLRFPGLGSRAISTTGQLDLRRPGRVAQQTYVPPMRPRAVAPPVGDMAVGTMLINNRSFVNVSGPPVTLTLNDAPAKDALMALARLGGYGFVYVDDDIAGGDVLTRADSGSILSAPVTMAFRNERFDRALNSVLLASGLQGKLDGRTLMVGSAVSAKTFGPQMSKVFRLNQVEADKAAQYLANLGAQISVTITENQTDRDYETTGASTDSQNVTESSTESSRERVETYGASTGPLLGLTGTTDSRLSTITLIGDPLLISVAEAYLKQLDLRKRQVAVKVQILAVQLDNNKAIDSSFSARMGNAFIVSQNGTAHINFGKNKPGNSDGTGVYDPEGSAYGEVGAYTAQVPRVPAQSVLDPVVEENRVVNPPYVQALKEVTLADGTTEMVELLDQQGRPIYVPSTDPAAEPQLVQVFDSKGRPVYVPATDPAADQVLKPRYDKYGRPVYVPGKDPAKYVQSDNSFYAYIESVITSTSAKVLAQPTLLVQEGEKAKVETGESVITGVEKNESDNGTVTFTNDRQMAGLTLDLQVFKIDDNGFVTMKIKPSISVPNSAGVQENVQIFNIDKRSLDSGRIRLRDGQSLILTGVIQDRQAERATKWPILGDMPIIGQFFRDSNSSRSKSELVVIVTPAVLDDNQGGTYGYGYRPATPASRELLQSDR